MWKSIGHFMEHTIRLNHDYQFTLKLGPSRLMPSNTKNPIDDLVGDLHCTHKIFAHPSFPPAGCLAAICFTTATPESQIGTQMSNQYQNSRSS